MSKTEEKIDKDRLSESDQIKVQFTISNVLNNLGSALGNMDSIWVKNDVEKAYRSISELHNRLQNTQDIEFTKEGASASRSMHSWLRKYEDCHMTSALYNRIHIQAGYYSWYVFSENIANIIKKSEKDNVLRNLLENATVYQILNKAFEYTNDHIRYKDMYDEDILTTLALIEYWVNSTKDVEDHGLKEWLMPEEEEK